MASCLPLKDNMDQTCQHCGGSIVGNAYRVTSEEAGITLLDMIVCSLCFEEAKRLHLRAEEVDIRSKQTSARNRRVHQQRRDN
jgi:ribosome-binding protein aMBF1 (putative translation factor)